MGGESHCNPVLPIDVVSVQSQVVYGRVGNAIAVPSLQRRGLRVAQVPTVLLSNTPHYPTVHGGPLPPEWLAGLLQGLVERGVMPRVRAVLTGYVGYPQQAQVLAQWLQRMGGEYPQLLVCMDPVLGDHDHGLYVDAQLPAVYREQLLPLAQGLTPNHFELEMLAGRKLDTTAEVIDAARELLQCGPQWVVVTSAAPADARAGELQLAVVTPGSARIIRHALIPVYVKGTGDLFTAELLAGLLSGKALVPAVQQACRQVRDALLRTHTLGWEELALNKRRIVPRHQPDEA